MFSLEEKYIKLGLKLFLWLFIYYVLQSIKNYQVDKRNTIKIKRHNRKTETDSEGNTENGISRHMFILF